MENKKVAIIEGEDSSPELMKLSVRVIQTLALPIEWNWIDVGQRGIELYGDDFSKEAREAIDSATATFFGSTNGSSKKAFFYLRWGKKTYANVRPVKFFTGYKSPLINPDKIDFIIVRENLEDMYAGFEGDIRDLESLNLVSAFSNHKLNDYRPAKYALKIISEKNTRPVVRYAFELARKRRSEGKPGKVACGIKHNILCISDGLFYDIARQIAAEYPDIKLEIYFVDDLAHRLVVDPNLFDVIVMPNLYGDILSDLAAGLIGGLGHVPSGCYGEDYAYFEPVHGSAPDLTGKNIINPTAALLSGAMLLEYLEFPKAALKLRQAIAAVYSTGKVLTVDQGGRATTEEFCNAVIQNINLYQ